MIELAGEPLDSRLVQHLLSNPMEDGGQVGLGRGRCRRLRVGADARCAPQWDMLVNVISKHGIVPKSVFGETSPSTGSLYMNRLLMETLREGARRIREAAAAAAAKTTTATAVPDAAGMRAVKQAVMDRVQRILMTCLGTPPASFDWEYETKDGKFEAVRGLSPIKFAEEYVGVLPRSFVSLVNDPRHPYNRLITVRNLGNVVGGVPVRYINVESEVLAKYSKAALDRDEIVWWVRRAAPATPRRR